MCPTLEELEGDVWGPPTYHSHLVSRCHALRTKPIEDFSIEDLRIMIGQGIGLPHLMKHAINILDTNPLAEGDFFPGDLVSAAIRSNNEMFFRENVVLARQIAAICSRAAALIARKKAGGLRSDECEFIANLKAFAAAHSSG